MGCPILLAGDRMGKCRPRTLPDKTGREDLGKGPWTDGFPLCLWASSGLNMIILCWSPSEAHRQGAQPKKTVWWRVLPRAHHRAPRSEVGFLVLAPKATPWDHPGVLSGSCPALLQQMCPVALFHFLSLLALLASSHCGVFNLYKPPSACASPHPTI